MNELEVIEKSAVLLNRPKSIQFFHAFEERITYALDVNFNKHDLLEAVHHFDKKVLFNVGCSFVHPNDVYTKSVGRDISSTRLEPVEFKLDMIHNHGEKIYLRFQSDSLNVEFRVCNNSDKPHLISISHIELF